MTRACKYLVKKHLMDNGRIVYSVDCKATFEQCPKKILKKEISPRCWSVKK